MRRGLVTWCAGGLLAAASVHLDAPDLRPCGRGFVGAIARAQGDETGPMEQARVQATAPGAVDLSPERAARSMLWDDGAPQAETSSRLAASGVEESRREAQLAAEVPGLSRVGHDDAGATVVHGAQDLTASLLRPWLLLFEPLRAGRYRYRGTAFDAVIRADGGVAYRAKAGVHLSITQPQRRDGRPGKPGLALGTGDPRRWLEKLAGNDPDAAERRAFLDRTRALRELLNERARREAERRADAWLDQRLERIVASSAEARAKHDALFALWVGCADDEIGAIGRARIEAFVRRHCARGSECEFSASDLGRLNAGRHAGQRFDPYATAGPRR